MGTNCKKCGEPLSFVKIKGKLHPRNLDGSDHFDLCSELRTKAVKKKGKPFSDKTGEGFVVDGKKVYMLMSSGSIKGKDYKPEPIPDGEVPW